MNRFRFRLDLWSPWHLALVFLAFGSAGWLLQTSPVLVFDVEGDGGIAQVFHSADGNWSEAASIPTVVLPGRRTVSLRLPWSLPEQLRFDPITHAGSVTIRQVRYEYLAFRYTLAPEDITSLRDRMFQSLTAGDGGSLQLLAHDGDPQLSIAVPAHIVAWRCAGVLLASLPLVLLAALLPWSQLRDRQAAAFAISVAALGGSFAAFAYMVGWSEASVPILDDWRYFYPGRFSLIDGHGAWLGAAGNDTYFLTGQVADWSLLKLTGGDTRMLRMFAVGLLAPFFGLAAALARRHAECWSSLAVAGMSLTLGARAYWSHQFIAYHQFLPVLALFVVVWILGRDQREHSAAQRFSLVFCSLMAGLAYISGAVLFATVALVWAVLHPLALRPAEHRRHPVVWYVGIPALLTLAVQLWLVTASQGSLAERSHAGEMSWPTQERFWAFLVGLFGRTAGIPGGYLWLDALVCLAFVVLAGAMVVRTFARRSRGEQEIGFACTVSLALFAGAFVYAGLVAAGRAALGTGTAGAQAIADIAKWRFHYWWLAGILPLAGAIALNVFLSGRRRALVLSTSGALVLILAKSGAFARNDVPYFAHTREEVRAGAACVRAEIIRNGGLRSPINCPSFYPGDLTPALQSAEAHGAVFARELLQSPAH